MPKKGHSEEQIMRALRQVESGTRASEICREYGINNDVASFATEVWMVSRISKWLPEAYTSALLSAARKGVIFRRDDSDEVVAK